MSLRQFIIMDKRIPEQGRAKVIMTTALGDSGNDIDKKKLLKEISGLGLMQRIALD